MKVFRKQRYSDRLLRNVYIGDQNFYMKDIKNQFISQKMVYLAMT